VTALHTLPLVDVRVDGDDANDPLAMAILELEIAMRTYEPAACELRLRDATGALAARLALGAKLQVRLGAEQRLVFEGRIAAIEYALGAARERVLRLLAFDALHELGARMPVRVHLDVTFADLARELTRDLGINVEALGVTPLHRRIVQHRRSDLDVLADVAERAGLAFRLEGDALRVYPIGGAGPAVELEYGATLREARVVRTTVDAAQAIEVSGWDVQRGEARHGAARGGAGESTQPLTNVLLESDAHADALARSQLARRTLAGMHLHAVADGDPQLRPGTRVTLTAVPEAIAGPHAITTALHRFSPEFGYVTTIDSELPRPHAPTEAVSGTLGVVVDVRDPAALGRVKVKYPALSDAESDWLQVLAAGAGGGKGLVALPAVNDSVLVLVLDGDPGHGIVVGALYGTSGMPERRKGTFSGYAFYSPKGHVIELDDAGALSLHAAGGSYLELGQKKTVLHCETDLTIEAPGKLISLFAQRVEIDQK
jgi:uncharacterized protein involved in type VI secretion and phage assembly